MSDPVQNVEIEDVLSSIRRLVSEDVRPKFDRQAIEGIEKNEQQENHPAPEKLVLTQALRVVDDSVENDDAQEYDKAESDSDVAENGGPFPEEIGSESETIHAGFDQNDDSVNQNETDVQQRPDMDQDINPDLDETQFTDEIEGETSVNDNLSTDYTEYAEGHVENPVKEQAEHPSTLETRFAEMENAVAEQPDQWEPDGEGQGDNAAQPVEAIQWEDHDEILPTPDSAPNSTLNSALNSEEYSDGSTDLDAQFETDTVGSEAALQEDGYIDDSVVNDNQDVDLFGADDAILDEEALREMVSDIVRQELQGPLGERITRNVRKLVRREIHRALASQELN